VAKMGESNQPPSTAPPVMVQPAVGAGASHQPYEQLLHLPCCINSNPPWGKELETVSAFLFTVYVCECAFCARTILLIFY
jgi:hypothetical protein